MDVKSVHNSSIEDLDHIGVAICRPDKNKNQQHIGFVYKDADDNVRLLHLRWHYELSNDEFSNEYLWLELPIDPINKMHLATVCSLIVTSNVQGIPYSLGLGDSNFTETGNFVAQNSYAGLTCATFVMRVFDSQRLPIIDLDKWKHRKSDKKWQRQILQKLELWLKHKNYEEKYIHGYLAYQNRLINAGCARYKPEEVAAASAMESPPHGAESVKKPAAQLLNDVIAHSKTMTQRH